MGLQGLPFYSKGQYLLLPAPLDTINVHVREGHVIPQQVRVWGRTEKLLDSFGRAASFIQSGD